MYGSMEIYINEIYKEIELLDIEWQNKLLTLMSKSTSLDMNSNSDKSSDVFLIFLGIIFTIPSIFISGVVPIIFRLCVVIFGILHVINKNNKTKKIQSCEGQLRAKTS
ncbi:MAG: hypothetical protein ACJAUH_003249 [Saprospiraceae bacterium]|jgi:hypothetical protein